jgi:hypothetical protein
VRRAAAEREARAAAERAERHAAERHAAERAAREAATLMEAERRFAPPPNRRPGRRCPRSRRARRA